VRNPGTNRGNNPADDGSSAPAHVTHIRAPHRDLHNSRGRCTKSLHTRYRSNKPSRVHRRKNNLNPDAVRNKPDNHGLELDPGTHAD
jgi:hypothetical protein